MSSPTVSVVIPCFNQGHFLREALDSVMTQTLQPEEIVVVDDGSTDDTAAVARTVSQRPVHPPAEQRACIRQERRGNTHDGRSTWFFSTQTIDCGLMRWRLASRESLAHPACALVWGRCVRIDEHGRELPTVPPPPVAGDAYEALLRNNFIWTPGRRDVQAVGVRPVDAVQSGCRRLRRLRALSEDSSATSRSMATQRRWLNIGCTAASMSSNAS